MTRLRILNGLFLIVCLIQSACSRSPLEHYSCQPKQPLASKEQIGDSTFCAEIAEPAYAFGKGPKVLFDEAHSNYGKISPDVLSPQVGRYHAFGELLKADGYRVEPNRRVITEDVLQAYQLLAVIAPLPGEYFLPSGPNPVAYSGKMAFQDSEVAAIRNWVEQGGSFLFNTEHSPFLPSAKNLLSAFGLAVEPNAYAVMTLPGQALEIAAPTHPIFLGRSRAERIEALPTPKSVGGGVHLTSTSSNAVAITRFGLGLMMTETLAAGYANQRFHKFCKSLKDSEVSGECAALQKEWQAGTKTRITSGDEPMKVLEVGKGRVAVFTEFSTLTSQIAEANSAPYGGLRDDGYTQLTLNTLHWLTRLIGE